MSPGAIRARHHPGAIVGVWLWRTFLAVVAAWPAGSLVRAAYGGDPRGDAPLFTAGSLPLLDFLWRDAHGVTAAAHGTGLVLLVGAILGLIPMAALMVALVWPVTEGGHAGFVRSTEGALRLFPKLSLVAVGIGLGQALVIGSGYLLARLTEGLTQQGLGEARAQQLAVVLALPFAGVALAIAVAHDLARAAIVRFGVRPMQAIVVGAQTLWRSPAAVLGAWGWRTVVSLACVAAASAGAARLGGRGGWALLVLTSLHQIVIAATVALRASWLAKALRCVRSPPYLATSER